jgi:hypothetical protein
MANLTTAGIYTLSLSDGTTYSVEVRLDSDALALALGRKALYNRTGIAKEVGGLVEVRTVKATAARAAIAAAQDARLTWETRLDIYCQAYRAQRGLAEYAHGWSSDEQKAYKLAIEAWTAANPKPDRVWAI